VGREVEGEVGEMGGGGGRGEVGEGTRRLLSQSAVTVRHTSPQIGLSSFPPEPRNPLGRDSLVTSRRLSLLVPPERSYGSVFSKNFPD